MVEYGNIEKTFYLHEVSMCLSKIKTKRAYNVRKKQQAQMAQDTLLDITNYINIINDYKKNHTSQCALKTISIIESVYGSKKLFDDNFFEFLNSLETRKVEYWLRRGVNNVREVYLIRRLLGKDIEMNLKILAILIESQIYSYPNIVNQNTKYQKVDDVLVLEFGDHKITMLIYKNKLRLHSIHHKYKNRTKLFSNYSFKDADEAFNYFNNIDEYSEFNSDVLEMIHFN